jgi:hypothetical protein
MLKYCYHKWDCNKNGLREVIRNDKNINSCDYLYLVKLVTKYILNGEFPSEISGDDQRWDSENITTVDNGDYQGTLLFFIPRNWYQPSEYDYLLTYASYGSCSGCDSLMGIQEFYRFSDDLPTEEQVKEYMNLCKDLVTNMVKPYNNGWRYDDLFEHVTAGG